jgi:hypothetical protein
MLLQEFAGAEAIVCRFCARLDWKEFRGSGNAQFMFQLCDRGFQRFGGVVRLGFKCVYPLTHL